MSEEASTLSRLKQSFQLLLPLVDDLADALGLLLMISLAVIIWVFIYLFHLHHFSLSMSLGVSFLSLITSVYSFTFLVCSRKFKRYSKNS
jgi:hypothetical protein